MFASSRRKRTLRTKRQVILKLFASGMKRRAITKKTGYSPYYVQNVVYDFESGGGISRAVKRYRKKYPDKRREWRKTAILAYQAETLPNARKHGKKWSSEDLAYLRTKGRIKTARQLALYFGRTYRAVQQCGQRHEIDMRGDKIGANKILFRKKSRKKF